MKKTFIFFLGFILTIGLTTTIVFASDLEQSSEASTKLPYLAPDLDGAKAYATAVKIAENSGTRDVTHTIDDLYSLIISMRTYVNSNYQMRTYDSAVLSAIQDLNGYGTAYNTHSMLMDMWMRIGGNSSLGNTYNITDMLADLSDTINDGLIITDGNETYTTSELLAGIYGIYSTPRSIPDLYNKLTSIDTYVDSIDTYVQNSNGYLYSIEDAISRLADIYASQDVADAKAAQQQYEDESIADFTGSGTGAATTANKNDIKGISSTVKSGLNTGGSASTALGVFTYNGATWDWFTTTTLNNLYTVPNNYPDAEVVYLEGTYTCNNASWYSINLSTRIPYNTPIFVIIEFENTTTNNIPFYTQNLSNQHVLRDTIPSGTDTYTTSFITENKIIFDVNFRNMPLNTKFFIRVYKPVSDTRKSNDIPDFISEHDRNYYQILENKYK